MGATIVSLEGNIGAGKSTLLRSLAEVGGVRVVPEPIEAWCAPALPGGGSMLQAYYADKRGTALAFQMYAMLTRAQQLRAAAAEGAEGAEGALGALVVVERNSWSDYELFGRPMHASGLLNDAEWHTYTAWFHAITDGAGGAGGAGLLGVPRPNGIVYLASNPDTCARRIRSRSRDGEADIDRGYLEMLHDAHTRYVDEQILAGTPVFVVDGNALGADRESQLRTAREIVAWSATTALGV